MARGCFKREDRLLRAAEFRHMARQGGRAEVKGFLLMAARHQRKIQPERVRLGVTVSRRVGNAVVRNRLKRWIREWFRTKRAGMRPDLDIVVIARHGAAEIPHQEVTQALEGGARGIGLLA